MGRRRKRGKHEREKRGEVGKMMRKRKSHFNRIICKISGFGGNLSKSKQPATKCPSLMPLLNLPLVVAGNGLGNNNQIFAYEKIKVFGKDTQARSAYKGGYPSGKSQISMGHFQARGVAEQPLAFGLDAVYQARGVAEQPLAFGLDAVFRHEAQLSSLLLGTRRS